MNQSNGIKQFIPQQGQENKRKQFNNTSIEFDNQLLINTKFVINNLEIVTAFKIKTTIAIIKNKLAHALEVEEDIFDLEIDCKRLGDNATLSDIGAHPHTILTFKLIPKQEEQKKLITKIKQNLPTLDVITVHVGEGEYYSRDVIVEINNQCPNKEWLGGFRNKLTSIEYHNAVAQTAPRLKLKRKDDSSESGGYVPLMFHRDTQTPFKPKDMTTDTMCTQATQTYRSDLFSTATDHRLVNAGHYIPHCIVCQNEKIVKAVIVIQRATKNWIYKKKVKKLREYNKDIRAEILRQKMLIVAEEEQREREILTGAVFPVNRDDFYMLYLMVGNWWKKEWKRICGFSKESKQAESNLLLFKEIQLLNEIEKQRITVKKEALQKANVRFLEQISSPVIVKNAKGEMIYIDDLPSQQAREFKEIYSELIRSTNLPKERTQFLLTFKQLFSSDKLDFEYSKDLVTLIDREIVLLNMGIKLKNLRGLHKRIEQLFLLFLQQKEFNPKCVKYKEPNAPKTIHTLFQCTRCLKLLPVSKYPVHVRMREYDICISCTWLKNIGFNRVDMSPYVKLLNTVRNTEMEKGCSQAVCFILQPTGMSHLTEVIWHGRSVISECSDISKLQHVRWLSHLEWSPWNTILLTNQEAKCHRSIQDVFQFYDKSFIEQVKYKHILARGRFKPLLKMNHDICSSGDWSKVKES